MIEDSKYKIGHNVYMDGITSMASGGGADKISDIDIRFDTVTGKPFHIYQIGDRWWTESEGYGSCYDNPQFMYDISYDYFVKKPHDVKAVLLVMGGKTIPEDGIEMKTATPHRSGELLLITHDGNELGELRVMANSEGKAIDVELIKY